MFYHTKFRLSTQRIKKNCSYFVSYCNANPSCVEVPVISSVPLKLEDGMPPRRKTPDAVDHDIWPSLSLIRFIVSLVLTLKHVEWILSIIIGDGVLSQPPHTRFPSPVCLYLVLSSLTLITQLVSVSRLNNSTISKSLLAVPPAISNPFPEISN